MMAGPLRLAVLTVAFLPVFKAVELQTDVEEVGAAAAAGACDAGAVAAGGSCHLAMLQRGTVSSPARMPPMTASFVSSSHTVGNKARLDDEGYKNIVNLHSKTQLRAFVQRVLLDLDLKVVNEDIFRDYVGSLSEQQDLNAIRTYFLSQSEEPCGCVRRSNQVVDVSGLTAPITEDGLRMVASLRSAHEMFQFGSRVMQTEGFRLVDPGSLEGMLGYYSCEKGVQSLERMRQELRGVAYTPNGWVSAQAMLMQTREGQKTSSEKVVKYKKRSSESPTIGTSAALNDEGYKQVLGAKSNIEMSIFVLRTIRQMGFEVIDENQFHGMIPYYSGDKGSQAFDTLQKEIKKSSKEICAWLAPDEEHKQSNEDGPEVSGKLAPLTEDGYEAVARLRSPMDTRDFVKRVLQEMHMQVVEKGGLMGFVPYHDCEHGAKSLKEMRSEIIAAAIKNTWVRGLGGNEPSDSSEGAPSDSSEDAQSDSSEDAPSDSSKDAPSHSGKDVPSDSLKELSEAEEPAEGSSTAARRTSPRDTDVSGLESGSSSEGTIAGFPQRQEEGESMESADGKSSNAHDQTDSLKGAKASSSLAKKVKASHGSPPKDLPQAEGASEASSQESKRSGSPSRADMIGNGLHKSGSSSKDAIADAHADSPGRRHKAESLEDAHDKIANKDHQVNYLKVADAAPPKKQRKAKKSKGKHVLLQQKQRSHPGAAEPEENENEDTEDGEDMANEDTEDGDNMEVIKSNRSKGTASSQDEQQHNEGSDDAENGDANTDQATNFHNNNDGAEDNSNDKNKRSAADSSNKVTENSSSGLPMGKKAKAGNDEDNTGKKSEQKQKNHSNDHLNGDNTKVASTDGSDANNDGAEDDSDNEPADDGSATSGEGLKDAKEGKNSQQKQNDDTKANANGETAPLRSTKEANRSSEENDSAEDNSDNEPLMGGNEGKMEEKDNESDEDSEPAKDSELAKDSDEAEEQHIDDTKNSEARDAIRSQKPEKPEMAHGKQAGNYQDEDDTADGSVAEMVESKDTGNITKMSKIKERTHIEKHEGKNSQHFDGDNESEEAPPTKSPTKHQAELKDNVEGQPQAELKDEKLLSKYWDMTGLNKQRLQSALSHSHKVASTVERKRDSTNLVTY